MSSPVDLPTRGLTIKQPHIGRILNGHKVWELRSTNTKIRGPIALIESGSGHIYGFANLFNTHSNLSFEDLKQSQDKHKIQASEIRKAMDDGKWKWSCAWELSDIKLLEPPIPYTHNPGAVIWINFREEELPRIQKAYKNLCP